MNSGTSPVKPMREPLDHDVINDEGQVNEQMQQELLDSQLRIESLRIELQRAENDVYKTERLWKVWSREKCSKRKFVTVTYLTISCLVPDVVKWLLRPFTRPLKRVFRRLEGPRQITTYQVKLAAGEPPQLRVLHAIANFMTGGSSRLVVDIVEGLGHTYHQEILTGFIPAPLAYTGVAIHECRSPFAILSFLQELKPDVLHVHYWGDVDFAWYDKVFRAADEIGCKVVENINTPVVPYRCQPVQHYVYVSDYVMRTFGRPDESSTVIHPGSQVEFFSRSAGAVAPDNCIGMVYRLEADKLNMQSIDVFIEVAKRRPNTKILIVGDGSFLVPYKQAALVNGVASSFTFTGAVPYSKLPHIYAQLSVFVAPVWKESFGQVSSFAMSMGIPVVGYRVGGLEEIVDDDALLAPTGDAGKLADIVIKLLDDKAMRSLVGNSNRARAQALFSVEKMVEKYEALYRSVIDGSK